MYLNIQRCSWVLTLEIRRDLALTVVEWKDYHFLAVATISDLQNSYCNQWPHPYEPQISGRFDFSAVCLHFTAILVKFAEKTSAIKTKCL